MRVCGEHDSLIQRREMFSSIFFVFYALIPYGKTMQGKPLQSNSRSTRCGCPALMWVLRSDDKGWYICEHKAEHNHAVSVNCMEKLHWKSHRHIDRYIRGLVKQLRENNVSLSKVYTVAGSFFWICEGGAIHEKISQNSLWKT